MRALSLEYHIFIHIHTLNWTCGENGACTQGKKNDTDMVPDIVNGI